MNYKLNSASLSFKPARTLARWAVMVGRAGDKTGGGEVGGGEVGGDIRIVDSSSCWR